MNQSISIEGRLIPCVPRVSIISPVWNGAAFIGDALASVERQAAHIAIEHVVADGGSTDGTIAILQKAAWVRGVSRRDGGLYDALNWTVEQARGEYLQWLNADDELGDDFLAEAVEILDRNPDVDAVLGDTLFTDVSGRPTGRWSYNARYASSLRWQARSYLFLLNSALFRSEVLRGVLPFDQARFPLAADRDVELRLLQAGLRIATIPCVAYRFRQHEGSLTTRQGAARSVMIEAAELFEQWSHNPTLAGTLRCRYSLWAAELRVGLSMKLLSDRRTYREALPLMAETLRGNPAATIVAIPSWLRRKLTDGFVPMQDSWFRG